MNYLFKSAHELDSSGRNRFIVHLKIDEWQRPVVGTQIILPISNKTWRVVRVEPTSNPEGNQNTYFVEEV